MTIRLRHLEPHLMRTIVQIAPEIVTGSGVEGVAYHLEQEFRAAGFNTERFTMADARGGWLPRSGVGVWGKLLLAVRVVWFSTVGSVLARRFLAQRPDAVGLCHNDVLAGAVYVNHGILRAAMHARGRYAWRMIRNPLHLFTAMRDKVRYASGVHQVVVTLTDAESQLLSHTYPKLQPQVVVIGNGVDTDRFRPASAAARLQARSELGLANALPAEAVCLLFVGHEFDRKGLPLVLEALASGPAEVHLLVVGGTSDMVARAQATAARFGVADRVHLIGRLVDPLPAFWAADAFIMPSAYESYGLVVLEALACGLPVLVTPTGCVPDLVVDGRNGWLVESSPASIRKRLGDLVRADREARAKDARISALPHAWNQVAARYLEVIRSLHSAKQSVQL
jgi:glycosyltransferase involved in cell wall biosynthesis